MQEWERFSLLCDVNEIEEMRIAKFLGGLREDITEKLMSTPNLPSAEMCSLAINYEKFAARKKTNHPTLSYNRNPRTQPFKIPNRTPSTPRREGSDSQGKSKNKEDLPLKEIVCFKYHGRGHYKSASSNARAFTIQEWREINNDNSIRTMLVAQNGKEEETWPSMKEGKPDGTYRVSDSGNLHKYEDSEESEYEEERERVLPEYNLVIRRNFHTTPKLSVLTKGKIFFKLGVSKTRPAHLS